VLKTLQEAARDIQAGRILAIAGEASLLAQLPPGTWIGGSIPYFMDASGGRISREQVFVQDLTEVTASASIQVYRAEELHLLPRDAPENGFSILIIPANSPSHITYARRASGFRGLFQHPVVGWIAGVHLDDLGREAPKVFDGRGQHSIRDAVVLHATLKPGREAEVGIINLFRQGGGDVLTFEEDGFQVEDCLVNGERHNLAEYLYRNRIDSRLPLVADYGGVNVNVSIQAVHDRAGTVDLYAPVFRHVAYRIAAPVDDYLATFRRAVPRDLHPVFACNCILNFLYSGLEGKVTEGMYGPITFGEIAFQLLNQTLVYLDVP